MLSARVVLSVSEESPEQGRSPPILSLRTSPPFPQPRRFCHCEPVRTLAWQSVLFCVFVVCSPGMTCANQDPFSFWCLPKKKTVLGLQKKKALVGGGEPKGGTGVAACGRTIRGAPAVRSAAARSVPSGFSPHGPCGSALSTRVCGFRVILSEAKNPPDRTRPLRTGNGGLPPPGAGEGRPGFPQPRRWRAGATKPGPGTANAARWISARRRPSVSGKAQDKRGRGEKTNCHGSVRTASQ